MSHIPSRRAFLAGGVASLGIAAGAAAHAAPPSHSNGQGKGHGYGRGNGRGHGHGNQAGKDGAPVEKPEQGGVKPMTGPLQFGYFRTWHDKAADPTRPNSIADVPREVDLVFVFPDYTPPENPFWSTLRDQYVPTLHSRGQRLVRTTDIRSVLDKRFEDNPAGHRANAEAIIEEMVEAQNLDGLDIDMESALDADQTIRAMKVFEQLATFIGPESGTDKLFIYDTNRDGEVRLFQRTAHLFDYVLLQAYGRSPSSLDSTWQTFAPFIPASKFMPGFSFYEERDGNRWNDTAEPFETSRAAAYADWQPKTAGTSGEAKKAGIFSYAIDRDWVALGDDAIKPATYDWSKRLKARMLAAG